MDNNTLEEIAQGLHLFEDTPKDNLPEEVLISIPLEEIESKADEKAQKFISNLNDIYSDKAFMDANPKFMERLKMEMDSLRILIKMRMTDEKTHDCIVDAIGKKPENASLYKALTDVQRTILNISKQIDEKILGINNLLKNIQLEFNFKDKENDPDINIDGPGRFRGTKDFINSMKTMS